MRRINQTKSIFVCAVAAEARLVTAMVEVGAKGPARTLLMGDTQAAGMLTVKHHKKLGSGRSQVIKHQKGISIIKTYESYEMRYHMSYLLDHPKIPILWIRPNPGLEIGPGFGKWTKSICKN